MSRKSSEFIMGLAFAVIFVVFMFRRPVVPILDAVDTATGSGSAATVPSVELNVVPKKNHHDEERQQQLHQQKQPNPIRQISILGERNSGTRWTYEHVADCFGHGVAVERELTRYKHWFQYEDPTRYPHDTLVLAQFRNPYDWLKAMERVPHHAPAHFRLKAGADLEKQDSQNDWRLFLTKPWTMDRFGADIGLPDDHICQENFRYRDIVSCVKEPWPHSFYNHTLRYSEHQPFYEMRPDGSGQPFANILEMRSAKIENFLQVSEYEGVAAVWVVQYEYLLSRGTQHLIERIAEWTGIQPHCQAKPPQARLQKKSRILSPDFCKHVRLHLNWTLEQKIGYEPDERREALSEREW